MKKKAFFTEYAYLIGVIILAFGTALMTNADFGVSMVVAPAYLLHLKISEFLPFFSFGMAEYTLQGVLLILMALILRKFRITYLFSFATAFFYGIILDLSMLVVGMIPMSSIIVRLLIYVAGFFVTSCGVSMLFHTYIPPEAYELFVKEVSSHFKADIHKFKTGYDCASLIISVIMSFVFFGFGNFVGIRLGTVFVALANGFTISRFTAFFEKNFEFGDALKFRSFFEKN